MSKHRYDWLMCDSRFPFSPLYMMVDNRMNADFQREEIEVLESIYAEDFQLVDRYEVQNGVISFTINVTGPNTIQLLVHLPSGYPTSDPPLAEIYDSFGITPSQAQEIIDDLQAVFERSEGQVCIYEWIENVREKYQSAILNQVQEAQAQEEAAAIKVAYEAMEQLATIASEKDALILRPRVDTAHQVRDFAREETLKPLIFHGRTLTDRKSTFQTHVCPVHSVEDVRSFLAILLDDRKIARATHNMLAYRIISGQIIIKDNDEDGEDGAGSKMSHLLELIKVENVAVVVSRWYGGIHLGPDRFKHINTSAREALEESGFLSTCTSDSSINNKKKQVKR